MKNPFRLTKKERKKLRKLVRKKIRKEVLNGFESARSVSKEIQREDVYRELGRLADEAFSIYENYRSAKLKTEQQYGKAN